MNTIETASGLSLINAQAEKNAQAAYSAHQSNIETLIKALRHELTLHEKRAAQQPKNWGFAGDLGGVQGRLEEIVGMLAGVE